MDNHINNLLKSRLKGLAYYQIVFGIIGIALTIWLLSQTGELTGLVLLLFIIAGGLYAFSIFCGQRLLKTNTKKALKLSFINQLIQVFNIGVAGYAYSYLSGPAILIGANLTDGFRFTFNMQLLPAFQFNWNSDFASFEVGVNLIALGIIYYIDRLTKEVKTSEELFVSSVKLSEELRQ